jgi:hypothetical protein
MSSFTYEERRYGALIARLATTSVEWMLDRMRGPQLVPRPRNLADN